MRVALLIDSAPTAPYHLATVAAINHAADAIGHALDLGVHRTDANAIPPDLRSLDGIVVGPGSPYRDERAVWDVVRSARERGVPLVGT